MKDREDGFWNERQTTLIRYTVGLLKGRSFAWAVLWMADGMLLLRNTWRELWWMMVVLKAAIYKIITRKPSLSVWFKTFDDFDVVPLFCVHIIMCTPICQTEYLVLHNHRYSLVSCLFCSTICRLLFMSSQGGVRVKSNKLSV